MKRIIGIIVALVVVVAVAFGLMHRNNQSDGRAADGRLNVVSSFSIINQISEEVGGKYVGGKLEESNGFGRELMNIDF